MGPATRFEILPNCDSMAIVMGKMADRRSP
jgi:hypothetical protein